MKRPGSVAIIKYTGEERDGNLVLKASCAQCGHRHSLKPLAIRAHG
jgi:hypothetical protein